MLLKNVRKLVVTTHLDRLPKLLEGYFAMGDTCRYNANVISNAAINYKRYSAAGYFHELQNRATSLRVKINSLATYDTCVTCGIQDNTYDIVLITSKKRQIRLSYNHKARLANELTFSLSGNRSIGHKSLIRVLSALLITDQKPNLRITINDAHATLSAAMSALLLLNSGDELSARILWDKDQEGVQK